MWATRFHQTGRQQTTAVVKGKTSLKLVPTPAWVLVHAAACVDFGTHHVHANFQ